METNQYKPPVTLGSDTLAHQHKVNQSWPLPHSVKEQIEAKRAEDQAVARLEALRSEIRSGRSRRFPPGAGVWLGVVGGLVLWGILALAVALW